jgi:hypothetical protein
LIEHGQTEKEIFASAGGGGYGEVLFVAASTRTSTCKTCSEPTQRSPFWEPQHFCCAVRSISPISSRKGAAVGLLEDLAFALGHRERAALMPEQLALDELAGSRRNSLDEQSLLARR